MALVLMAVAIYAVVAAHPIELRQLRGTLVCIPIVNVFGFINQTRYLPDGRVVEFTRSLYRGDAYDFAVELKLDPERTSP